MVLQGGEGPLGQGLAPQLVGQAFLGHVVAARHQEQLEHLLGLGAAEVPRAETALTRCHLDGAEQPGPHRRRLRSRTGRTHGVNYHSPSLRCPGVDLRFSNRAPGQVQHQRRRATGRHGLLRRSRHQSHRAVIERSARGFPKVPGEILTGVWAQRPALDGAQDPDAPGTGRG